MLRKPVRKTRKRRCFRASRMRKHLKCRKSRRRVKIKRTKYRIYGFDGTVWRPVLVDQKGKIEVSPAPPSPSRYFHEENFTGISAQNDWHHLPSQETSTQMTYSYAVVNRSANDAAVRIEVSPDNINYAVDREETVLPGETKVLVPTLFLKYTRISVRSLAQDAAVLVDVFYQAQSVY